MFRTFTNWAQGIDSIDGLIGLHTPDTFYQRQGNILMSHTRSNIKNVFEAILEYGHDEDFVPYEGETFSATDAPAGSDAKIEALRQRVLSGQPLWHDSDRKDYSGLTGAVRPRE